MGWSTQIVVARKWNRDERLCWETFDGHSIEIIEWNKLESLTGKIFVVKIDVLDENNRKFNIKEQQNEVSSD